MLAIRARKYLFINRERLTKLKFFDIEESKLRM